MSKKDIHMKKVFFSLLFISSIASATEYGIVKRVSPLHNMVATPVERCQQVTEYVPPSNDINYGTVLGGVAGGILGNQVGGGTGKTISTAIGTGVGAIVGHRIGQRDGYQTKTVCSTSYQNRNEVNGYNVIVDYNGNLISGFLNYNPMVGSRIPVNVTLGD